MIGAHRFVTQPMVSGTATATGATDCSAKATGSGLRTAGGFEQHLAAMRSVEQQTFTTNGIQDVTLRHGLFYEPPGRWREFLAHRDVRVLARYCSSRLMPSSRSDHGRTAVMITQHDHRPGKFDAGHCRACAREAGLLDYYRRVQWEEDTLRIAEWSSRRARRFAVWALCSSGVGILLAAIALLANH
jgi:hypothetical protein